MDLVQERRASSCCAPVCVVCRRDVRVQRRGGGAMCELPAIAIAIGGIAAERGHIPSAALRDAAAVGTRHRAPPESWACVMMLAWRFRR